MKSLPFRVAAASFAVLVMFAAGAVTAFAASPEDWAASYCKTGPKVSDALNSTTTSEMALVDALRTPGADVAAAVSTYDTELAKVARLAKKAAKTLKKTGAPDIKNGAKVNAAAIKAYKTVAKEIALGRAALREIDPANPTAASDPLFALGDALGNSVSAINSFSLDTLSPAVEKNQDLAAAVISAC
jgi:hypothetical protein